MQNRPDSLLWWRAGMVVTMTFLLGAVGHVGGGGLLPSWRVPAAMLVIGTPLCAVVLARPASTRRIVALVVSGQTACHVLLSVSAGHGGDPVGAPPIAVLDHLPMFLAHTTVAVVVGLWLAAGERDLRALLAMVFTAVIALFVVPVAVSLVARPGRVLRRRPATLPSLARASRCVVRRGPPVLLAV